MHDDPLSQTLLAAIRKSCATSVWSEAVELCRKPCVFGESANDDEVKIRVVTGKGIAPPTVTLWLEDHDWYCDCEPDSDVCLHAAAAVIAWRRARQTGQSLPAQDVASAKLSYRFSRTPSGLVFNRYIVTDAASTRLDGSLVAAVNNTAGPHRLIPQKEDLGVELALGIQTSGILQSKPLQKLLEALATCKEVLLDGAPVAIGGPCAPVRAVLEDCAAGFRLFVEKDPSITEIFANGAVLCGNTLRVIGELGLSAREMQELRAGQLFAPEQVSDLVVELLPTLRERVPLTITTKKLPEIVSNLYPRVLLETRRDGDNLYVLPSIVYGDPPVARLDGEKLSYLGGVLPLRHRDAERRLLMTLETKLGMSPGRRALSSMQEAISLADQLRDLRGKDFAVSGNGHESFFEAPALSPHFKASGNSFDLRFDSADGKNAHPARHADPKAVMRAFQRGESLVPLMEGGFAPLPTDWLARYGSQIADLLAAREAAASDDLPPAVLPDLAKLCAALDQPCPPAFDQLRTLVDNFDRIPPAPLPSDLKAQLRGYQQRGIDWLCFLREAGLGAVLADDMGLGKTIQALCALQGRSLVVAPTSVIHNWIDEVSRFRPGLSTCLYHGPERKLDDTADVTITSYAILRLDLEKLTAIPWNTVILDEAQTIKNPESQVAQAAYKLPAAFRMALSGTPVENRLEELWSQLHFTNRGLLGGRSDFNQRYTKPILESVPGAALKLRDRIRPFVLRRLKREVAPELPPRTDTVLRCTLSPEERTLYDSIYATTVPGVVERLSGGASVMEALEALLRLRQACCHPALIPGQKATSSTKVDILVETLDESVAEGHKSLVFSQWTSLLDQIEPALKAAGIRFIRLDGSTKDRRAVVAEFQSEGGPEVMLVSLKAGGTGLNLTAADHVFLLDPWWNPAVEDQAADRTHRIGQLRPIFVHRMVAENTVEERILELQERKRQIANAALGGSDQAVGVTRDDLLALLS